MGYYSNKDNKGKRAVYAAAILLGSIFCVILFLIFIRFKIKKEYINGAILMGAFCFSVAILRRSIFLFNKHQTGIIYSTDRRGNQNQSWVTTYYLYIYLIGSLAMVGGSLYFGWILFFDL